MVKDRADFVLSDFAVQRGQGPLPYLEITPDLEITTYLEITEELILRSAFLLLEVVHPSTHAVATPCGLSEYSGACTRVK